MIKFQKFGKPNGHISSHKTLPKHFILHQTLHHFSSKNLGFPSKKFPKFSITHQNHKMGIPKSHNSIDICSSDDDQSPIRAIFCLKNRTQNMEKIEELEDCFILDFDPSEPSPVANLKFSDDNDLSLISEKGQVACRDYPHPRHLCVKFPFDKTPRESHCEMCFCYICETEAPCRDWTTGLKHCNATSNGDKMWKALKDSCMKS